MTELIPSFVWVWGITAGVFVFLNNLASPASKKSIYQIVTSSSVDLNRLPEVVEGVFERIFGTRHFSIRCFLISLVASVISIAMFYVLRVIIILLAYKNTPGFLDQYLKIIGEEFSYPFYAQVRMSFIISVSINLLLDYLSLLKTRLLIKGIRKANFSMALGLVFAVLDFAIGVVLFQAFYVILYTVALFINFRGEGIFLPAGDPYVLYPQTYVMIFLNYLTAPGYPSGAAYNFLVHSHVLAVLLLFTFVPLFLTSVFFYASMMPSIWLWLFLFAVLTSRVFAPVYPWAIRAFDFEQNPIRTLGYMVATILSLAWALAWTILPLYQTAILRFLGT